MPEVYTMLLALMARTRRGAALALALLVGATTHPALAAPQDPADASVHRHILPAEALPLVLGQGEVEVVRWDQLLELMSQGRKERTQKRGSPKEADRPFDFQELTVLAAENTPGGDAQVTLEATLAVRTAGWRRIPLLGPGPTPSNFQARCVGRAAARGHLVKDGSGYAVLLEEAGTWKLQLEAWTPIQRQGHLRSLTLRVPPVAGAIGRATLQGEDLEVFMDPAPESRLLGVADGRTRVEAALPPGEPFQVQWFPRDAGLVPVEEDADAPEVGSDGLRELGTRVFAHWSEVLTLGHAGMQAQLQLEAQVLRAPVSELKIRLHGEHENLEVVRDSRLIEEVRPVPGGVDVVLKGEHQGAVRLGLRYRYQDPDGHPSFSIAVPRPSLVGAWSERRSVWIGRSTNVAVRPHLTGAVEPLNQDQPPSLPGAHDALLRYAVEDPEAKIELEVERYPDAPGIATRVVDHLTVVTSLSARRRSQTHVRLQVRDRRGAPIELKLPDGATPLAFRRGGVRIHPTIEGGVVNLPLTDETRRAGGEVVELEAEWLRELPGGPLGDRDSVALELPRVAASVMQLDWTVKAPPGYQLRAPGKQRYTPSTTLTRRLVQPDGDQAALALTVSLRSWQAEELGRAGLLVLGLAAGWLLCAILVGGLPLGYGLLLVVPMLLTGQVPNFGGRDPLADGISAALAIGTLVGLRRMVSAWWTGRKLRAARQVERTAALIKVRADLQARIRGEKPAPADAGSEGEAAGAPPGDAPPEEPPEPATEAEPSSKKNKKGGSR